MPSACTKPEKKQASTEVESPAKQCLVVVEKKVRNLEKKKGKLDIIREKAAGGTVLNEDQQEAVGRYEVVCQNLEFAIELKKQFASILTDVEKQLKKQAKRESHERQQSEIRRIKELLSLQNLLDSLGADDVRADFVGGIKGAVKLTEEELNKLDELYKLISPTRDEDNAYSEQLSTASEHIVNFLDAREKEVIGTTYKDLKALVEKINDCGYFESKSASSNEVSEATSEAADQTEEDESSNAESPKAEEPTPAATAEQEAVPEPAEEFIQPQPNNLDFAGEAAAASMLGQPQQPASVAAAVPQQQLLEPEVTEDTTATAAPDADTFFSTQPFPEPRPFQEIVSSVQANYTFLQDSEIEGRIIENPEEVDPAIIMAVSSSSVMDKEPNPPTKSQQAAAALDPAVMAAAAAAQIPVTQPSAGLSFLDAAAAASQYQTQELPDNQSAASGLQYQSDLQSQQPTSTAATAAATPFPDADTANMYSAISQALPPQSASQPPVAAAAGFGAADSDAPPQPIPMPAQYEQDQSQSAAAAAAPIDRNSRQFAMNPNANIFQSMYSSGDQQQPQDSSSSFPQAGAAAAAAGADNRQQQQPQQAWAGAEYQSQGYGNGQYGGRRGNQSGAPNGAGGYRGNQRNGGGAAPGGGGGQMNGYRGGNPRSAPGNRGGNSRGGYNGGAGGPNRGMQGQQGGGMRGPAGGNQGGGAYKGYPPRNDYQPEGGYQGYNAGGGGGGGFMPSQGGRGGPRNSVPRSGRGGGGYGNRMPPQ